MYLLGTHYEVLINSGRSDDQELSQIATPKLGLTVSLKYVTGSGKTRHVAMHVQ